MVVSRPRTTAPRLVSSVPRGLGLQAATRRERPPFTDYKAHTVVNTRSIKPRMADVEMAPAAAAPAAIDVEMAPAAAAKTSEDSSGPSRAQRRSERRMKNSITSESLPQRDDPQTSIAAAPATVDVENTGRERAATEPADVATRNRAAVERAHKASHGTRKSMGPLSSLVKVASRRIALTARYERKVDRKARPSRP